MLASFALCLVVPLLGASPYGDISSNFTDHLHHSYGTWLFWKHGLRVLSQPLALFASDGFRHPTPLGMQYPWMYPPGSFLYFTPLALLSQYVSLTERQFAQASIIYVIALSHVGIWLYARACLDLAPGIRVLLLGVGWLMMLHLCLQGFFDPFWLGCGAAISSSLARGKPSQGLLWFAAAASLHYRAAVFAPAAAAALWYMTNGGLRRASWAAIAITALSCAATLSFFAIVRPAEVVTRSHAPTLWALRASPLFGLTVLIVASTILTLLWLRNWVGAASFLSVGAVAFSDFHGYVDYWHHAAVILAVPLTIGFRTSERNVSLARQVALLACLALARLVWSCTPVDVLRVIAEKLVL